MTVNSSRKQFNLILLIQYFDRKKIQSHFELFAKHKRKKLAKNFMKTMHVIIFEFKSRPEKLSLKVDGES